MNRLGTLLLLTLLTFSGMAQSPNEVKRLTAQEYKAQQARQQDAVLLDVRTKKEYAKGHLRQAEHVDFLAGAVDAAMADWDKTKTYYFYCASGNRSGKTAKLLQEAGFEQVYNIGGFKTLQQAGLPTKKENGNSFL